MIMITLHAQVTLEWVTISAVFIKLKVLSDKWQKSVLNSFVRNVICGTISMHDILLCVIFYAACFLMFLYLWFYL